MFPVYVCRESIFCEQESSPDWQFVFASACEMGILWRALDSPAKERGVRFRDSEAAERPRQRYAVLPLAFRPCHVRGQTKVLETRRRSRSLYPLSGSVLQEVGPRPGVPL